MDATKDAAGQCAPPRSMEAHEAQLLEIAIEFLNDLLRVGNELALCFIHHGDQFSSDSRPATKVFNRRGVWRKGISLCELCDALFLCGEILLENRLNTEAQRGHKEPQSDA